MKKLRISEVFKEKESYDGKQIELKGWVHKVRNQSKFSFLVLRDISGLIQCFVDKPELVKIVSTLPSESVVTVKGQAKLEKQAPGGMEIYLEGIEIINQPVEDLPFQVYEREGEEEPALPIRLDNRWVDLRKPRNAMIFKVWTCMEKHMRDYWYKEGFIDMKSPNLIGIPSEGGAEAFTCDYFGTPAFLAQSPQFYKQMAQASGFEKVFEVGPIFRAENSLTARHGTEFTGIDMELSFMDNLEELMDFEEEWIVSWLTGLKEEMGDEIKEVFGREIIIPERPFPRMTFDEAMKILGKNAPDLGTDDEKKLGEYIKEKYGHEFVFVTKWPWEKRPFYHKKVEGEEYSDSFDLLWNGLEVTTGSLREHRYDIVVAQAKEKGIPLDNFESFFQFFKYGCPPHGGMGIGANRLLLKLLNIDNIREVTYLPRDPKRLTP
jgi:aspartyl-tRNA synthetase